MFKTLMDAWRKKTFLSEIIKDFEKMLVQAEQVFSTACDVWEGVKKAEEERDNLFSTDRSINEEEQTIRRRLLEHLAINPGMDTSACFVFISLVKDAERIGDYAKNIFELDELREGKFEGEHWEELKKIKTGILGNFPLLREAFTDSDTQKAQSIMKSHRDMGRRCEELIKEMVKKKLPGDESACFALMCRFYKRVSAHLANIASAITNPAEKIDFVTEGLL